MDDELKDKARLRKEIEHGELYELGIYVQDYELFISKQISEILPLVRAIPRFYSSTGEGNQKISFSG